MFYRYFYRYLSVITHPRSSRNFSASSIRPAPNIRINYLVLGLTYKDRPFISTIKQLSDDSVEDFLDTIQKRLEERFRTDCPPGRLQGYRVDIPLSTGRMDTAFTPEESCTDETHMEHVLGLGHYFGGEFTKPDKEKVQVLVKLPEVQALPKNFQPQTKTTIDKVFTKGLPYRSPNPNVLLNTSGVQWEFQASAKLLAVLSTAVEDHYQSFKLGLTDKTTIPTYLYLSGSGTGKSRHASEFHQSVLKSLPEGQTKSELRGRLESAWVFYVTLENGHGLGSNECAQDGMTAIGSRILLQLLGGSLTDILNTYQPPHPETVFQLIAKSEKKDLSQQTIILVVDGLHNLPDDLQFNGTLTELGNLSHGGFRLVCVTSTFRDRIETALKPSRRLRTYLPIEPLNPPTIRDEHGSSIAAFPDKTPLGQLLVRDCGGHGRALEILWNLIKGKDLKSTNLKEIMHDLRAKLTSYYPLVFRVRTEEKEAIVRAAFVHQLLYASDPLSGTGKTPDELCAPGLVWFEEDETATGYGRLKVAYICIWAMANSLRDPILRNWSFDDYSTLLEKVNEAIKPSWEEFKRFNIRFRCLKSQIFENGKLLTLTELHYGAKITGDIAFRNRHLTPSKAIYHTDTRTNICNKTQWLVTSLEGTTNMRECQHILQNASSAPYGDAFLCLDSPNSSTPVNEVHQYKLYSGQRNIREAEYQKERQKAASSTDFFILYTTQEHSGNFSLPQNSALVCQDNWDRYYGSFAGRAFIYGSGVGGK